MIDRQGVSEIGHPFCPFIFNKNASQQLPPERGYEIVFLFKRKGTQMTHPLLTIEVATALVAHLNEQAIRADLKGADGEALKFKAVRMTEDRRIKAAFEVRAIEMVRKQNLLAKGKDEGWFWIDRDTPLFLDPSSETYHSS